jgi:malic enzyme
VFIFPGVGLGAIVGGADEITDEMFRIAARRLARCVTPERLRAGGLYPTIPELRSVAREIAIAVAGHVLGTSGRVADDPVEDMVDRAMWWPAYLPLTSSD